ncbi:MAG: glycerophosphodiester phosphodiesterase family protein, partial [Microcella sp.]
YFAEAGIDMARLVEREVIRWRARGGTAPLIVESFEQGVLDELRRRELRARFVYLHERRGAAADLIAAHGRRDAPTWESQRTDAGLDALVAAGMHGLSVETSALSRELVTRAHARGLDVYTWTLRPENRFLPERHRIGSAGVAHGDWHAWFAEVAATGVDGVFADHPDLVREAAEGVGAAT